MPLPTGQPSSPRAPTSNTAIDPHSHETQPPEGEWMFELTPSQELPTLDLARTLKSEFFTPWMSRVFNTIRRRQLEVLISYLATITSYIVIMFVPASVGGYIALAGVLVGLPGTYVAIGQLRYDILKLLVRTFDVWFSSVLWLVIFVLLAIMFHDLRAVIAVSFWLGSWPNVCHDACLVTIRPIVIFNTICTLICTMIILAVNAGITDGLHDFVIMRVGNNTLYTKAIVTDGFVTIAALMLRNAYRRRDIVLRRTHTRDLECVIYRCQLKIVPFVAHRNAEHPPEAIAVPDRTDIPGHVQKMRFIPFVGRIDARNTLVPAAHSWITTAPTGLAALITFTAYASIVVTVCSSLSMISTSTPAHAQKRAITVGFALAVFHSSVSAALYNRTLLAVVYTSFDFVFIIVQATIVHVCVCDLFEWDISTVLLAATSWLWIHWLLLLDTLVPPIRRRLHIHRLLPRFGVICCTMGGFFLVYGFIFASPPARIVDRVLWSTTFKGHTVSYRLLPQFYSSLATLLFLSLRICWRHWRLNNLDLVTIDGPVVFTNSFDRMQLKLAAITPQVHVVRPGRTQSQR